MDMDMNELIDLMGEGKLKRRELLKGLAAFGIGAAILPSMTGRVRAADQASLFTWEPILAMGRPPAFCA